MTSSLGLKVLVGVLALISAALSVELYRTKAESRTLLEYEGVLTSDPPGTQLPITLNIAGDRVSATSPDRETYTVKAGVEYKKDILFRIKTLGVQGQILTGTLKSK